MRNRNFWLLLAATLWFSPLGGRAQAPAPKPQPPPTLAAALAGVPPAPDAVTLAVSAAQTTLPEGVSPPDGGAAVEDIARTFGRTAKAFGTVTAVAPPTMTLLNPDPHDPNIYLGMETSDVFTLLAASLDDVQWQALTGTRGLGLSDLGSDDQRQLFTALFPGGKLVVQHSLQATPALIDEMFAAMESGGMEQAGKDFEARQKQTRRDLSGDLPQARVRLAQDVQIKLPTAGKPDRMQALQPEMIMNAPPRDEIVRDEQYKPKDELFGVTVRETEPNALKTGDLGWDAPAYRQAIALGGLHTVGDLITRVGGQTRTELYVDPRWERQVVTFAPGALSAPAGDLLRAVAFCLTGTFRRVGPAYVLTTDPVGVGTIRRRWAMFEEDARGKAAVPVADAADRLFAARSPADLAPVGGTLDLSPAQAKGMNFNAAGDWERNASRTVPFAQLTPAQQEAARSFVALTTQLTARIKSLAQTHPELAGSLPEPPTLQGNVSLETRPVVQLVLPSETVPLEFLSLDMRTLFNPSNKRREQLSPPPKPRPTTTTPPKPRAPAPALKDILAAVRRRAVLAAPRTPAAVDALIVHMKALGLNELWLDVFSEGKSHFSAGNATQNDVLDEALRAAQGSGIRVMAVMDLFEWGPDAPQGALDRDILGETLAQADARERARSAEQAAREGWPPSKATPPDRILVSPFAPDVRGTLLAVGRALADRPGLSGLVWRGVVTPPGYAPASSVVSSDAPLGYADAARLSFLRAAHADPLDVGGQEYSRADTSLPGFDDDALATDLRTRWDKARADAHLGLLRALRAAAPGSAGSQPFLYVGRASVFGRRR